MSSNISAFSAFSTLSREAAVASAHSPDEYERLSYCRYSCRFQRSLDEITKTIGDHSILADLWTREIRKLEAKEAQSKGIAREIRRTQRRLEEEKEAIDRHVPHKGPRVSWGSEDFGTPDARAVDGELNGLNTF